MSVRKVIVSVTAALLLTACGADQPSTIESVGNNAGVVLEVGCNPGGVVALDTEFGGPGNQDSWLIGDGPAVELLGGRESLKQRFTLHDHEAANLVVNVAPTEGKCYVVLTDRVSGETLVRDTESGKDFTLTAELRRG